VNIDDKVLNDLARSGIDPRLAFADPPHGLGFGVTDDASVDVHPSLKPKPGLVIPYYGIDRSPMLGDDGRPFLRVRIFEEDEALPVGGFVKPKKKPKYLQGEGTGVRAYFCPIVDWEAVFSDKNQPVVITEGEKKAARACVEGFPTIALGGVFNFMQEGRFLSDLANRGDAWRGKIVYIAFDSDRRSNAWIREAERRLAHELSTLRHADVRLVDIPGKDAGYDLDGKKLPDIKVGLDDFLQDRGPQALADLFASSESMSELDKKVLQINQFAAWISAEGKVYYPEKGRYVAKNDFIKGEDAGAIKIERIGVSKKGPKPLTPLRVADEWLSHPNRRGYDDAQFAPGMPAVFNDDRTGQVILNTFSGLHSEEGDVSRFLRMTELVFGELNDDLKDFALKLVAYKAQNPGVKPPIAILLVGNEGGGKGLWCTMVQKAFEPYSMYMEANTLLLDYNGYLERNLILFVDEAQGDTMHKVAPRLRAYVVGNTMTINEKYRKAREMRSPSMFLITANDRAAGSFKDDDRRYFVVQAPNADPALKEFYVESYDWVNRQDGGKAIMHYLLNYDLKGWTPPMRAPLTQEKYIARTEGMTPIQRVAAQMKEADINIVFQWITAALDYAAQAKQSASAGTPAKELKRLTDLEIYLPLMPIRPFYTAEELNMIFPYLAEQLVGARNRELRELTPAQLSRQLRNAGIMTLKPADEDCVAGFKHNGKRDHYLIVSNVDHPCWKEKWTQERFSAAMKTFQSYGQIAQDMRAKK